jgi:hypothetical protein
VAVVSAAWILGEKSSRKLQGRPEAHVEDGRMSWDALGWVSGDFGRDWWEVGKWASRMRMMNQACYQRGLWLIAVQTMNYLQTMAGSQQAWRADQTKRAGPVMRFVRIAKYLQTS